ncbi:hypothetical protein [Acrocarpospora sp. B8E8]|uniref:hypothetical protein n=1 Tax=Acrocarpospora sp. B8E8 TaxID=3153572 RepID=UPI00325F0F0B
MTPTQKAAQIKTLLAELHNDLAEMDSDSDWDFDYAALLGELEEASGNLADVFKQCADNVDLFEDDEWQDVADSLANAASSTRIARGCVSTSAAIAKAVQDGMAASIAAASAALPLRQPTLNRSPETLMTSSPTFHVGQRVRTTVDAPAGWSGGFAAPVGTLGTVTAAHDEWGSYGVLLDGDPDALPAAYGADELAGLPVTVHLPTSVAAWIADQDIDLVEEGHRPGEREWREAFVSAAPKTGGIRLEISADAARELAGELSERADMEARMPSGHRIINPRTLRGAAEKILAVIPA